MRKEVSILAALGGLVFALASGCSSGSADQCTPGPSGDADCAAILNVGPGQAFCDVGTCRPKGGAPPAQPDSGTPTNDATTVIPCQSTDQCTNDNGGSPSICRQPGVTPCLPLENDICKIGPLNTSLNAWKNPNPIFIGVGLPTKGPDGSDDLYFIVVKRLIQLAEREWNAKTANGLDLPSGRRPLVPIYCDTARDPGLVQKAFEHVTNPNGLAAPAYVSGVSALIFPIVQAAQQRKTFLYLTDGGCDVFAVHASGALNGQCFTTFPQFTYSAPLMAKLSAGLEARARTARGLGTGDKIKIALLRSARPEALVLHDLYVTELGSVLEVNGGKAKDDAASYKIFADKLNPDGTIDYLPTAEEIAAFAPDILLSLSPGGDLHLYYIPLIEAAWKTSAYRPSYVASDDAAFAFAYSFSVGGNVELGKRQSGVHVPFSANSLPIYMAMDQRFTDLFGDGTYGVGTGFDAYYATAYAIAAALTSGPTAGPLSGADIAKALRERLSSTDPNEPVTPFDPDAIVDAVAKLRMGKSINLRGTQTELDWNPVTGIVDGEASAYCLEQQPGAPLDLREMGYTYSTKNKTFSGTDTGCQ